MGQAVLELVGVVGEAWYAASRLLTSAFASDGARSGMTAAAKYFVARPKAPTVTSAPPAATPFQPSSPRTGTTCMSLMRSGSRRATANACCPARARSEAWSTMPTGPARA